MDKSIKEIIFPQEDIMKFINAEFDSLRESIRNNISKTGKTASGKTAESLRIESSEYSATLIGRGHFEELETGTPPRSQPANFNEIIKDWAETKGIPIMDEASLNAFSFRAANMIEQAGSKQYREGIRVNIYSDEVQESWQRIDDYIGNRIEWFLKTIQL